MSCLNLATLHRPYVCAVCNVCVCVCVCATLRFASLLALASGLCANTSSHDIKRDILGPWPRYDCRAHARRVRYLALLPEALQRARVKR